ATLADWLERSLNLLSGETQYQRLRGGAILFVLLLIICLLGVLLIHIPVFGIVFEIGILYLALGYASQTKHAQGVEHALANNDPEDARLLASYLSGQDTGNMDADEIAGITTEAVIENGNDAIVATLFWYIVAGIPGALVYRLTHTLDTMWKNRTPHLDQFSWVAKQFIFLLNWIPVRLCGLTYVTLSWHRKSFETWWEIARQWNLGRGKVAIASGAYSLDLKFGGNYIQQGMVRVRPCVGTGKTPTREDIPRALRLVYQTTWSWVVIILVADMFIG
ncbi:cobalamin biosynthesis protein, partial [Pseudomonadota bacterium]